MKKKLSIVLAVVLTLTLLLTSIAFAAEGHWEFNWDNSWGGTVSNWLDMTHYEGDGDPETREWCGPSSGVSIGQYYKKYVLRSEVVENFEWGNDGTSLAESEGNLDWTVEKSWFGVNPLAEIDDTAVDPTAQAHTGTRSARFYNDSGYMIASYSHAIPTHKRFWLKKDENAIPCMVTGDGNHRIWIRVNSDNQVQYYDGSWKDSEVTLYFWGNDWHCIELKNIDWVRATYDICVDCSRYSWNLQEEVPMQASLVYEGKTAYYNGCGWDGMGSEFWIDDILDVRTAYQNLPGEDEMYDALHESMGTSPFGYTDPSNYGPGFVEMALYYGYDNFDCEYYESVTADDYGVVVNAIDNGWPVALAAVAGFSGVEAIETDGETEGENAWPCKKGHYIAIKGYSYYSMFGPHQYWPMTRDHRIRCTDSYSDADELVLDWDELVAVVGGNLRMIIIKD